MGLLPKRGVRVQGSVTFDGRQLLTMDDNQLRSIRGRDIAMVFQDPMSSLNPVVPIGRQVTEVLERHRDMSGPKPAPRRRGCSKAWVSRIRIGGYANTRISCPAACASAP